MTYMNKMKNIGLKLMKYDLRRSKDRSIITGGKD